MKAFAVTLMSWAPKNVFFRVAGTCGLKGRASRRFWYRFERDGMLPRSQFQNHAFVFVGNSFFSFARALSIYLGFSLKEAVYRCDRYQMTQHGQLDRKRFSTEPLNPQKAKSRKMLVPQNSNLILRSNVWQTIFGTRILMVTSPFPPASSLFVLGLKSCYII